MTITEQITDRGLYGKSTVDAIERLVVKHLTGPATDPLPAAREILAAHFDALVIAGLIDLSLASLTAALTARGVTATPVVFKAARFEFIRERMYRTTSGGVPSALFAG